MKSYLKMCGLFLTFSLAIAQTPQTIMRSNVQLRTGAGSYYPMLGILPEGARVEVIREEAGWANIRFQDQTGWVSNNAFEAALTSRGLLRTTASTEQVPTLVSKASASGAVRGLADRFIAFQNVSDVPFDPFEIQFLTAAAYSQFKQTTFAGRNPERIRNRYKLRGKPVTISNDLQQVGLAIANLIADSKKLSMDRRKLQYLNSVGTLIVENSDVYEYPFNFYLIRDPNPAAYATPNGIIFISEGLLRLLDNEAELAAVLGHEIAHVARMHGYQEVLRRKEMIIAEGDFENLDKETEDEFSAVADELDNLALLMFEAASAATVIEYEYEADKLGMIYAYRAGYDPNALKSVLSKIQNASYFDFENSESHWALTYIGRRLDRINKLIDEDLRKRPEWNVTNAPRFQSICR